MTNLYHVYQADGYDKYYTRIIAASSPDAAIEYHKQHWREMFDKPDDVEPHDETYANRIDTGELSDGEIIEL